MKLPQSILRDLGGSCGNPELWVIGWTLKPRFSWWIMLLLELWPMTSSGLKMKDWLWFLHKFFSFIFSFWVTKFLLLALDLVIFSADTEDNNHTTFSCEECGRTFNKPRFLRRHMKTHSSQRPLYCCPRDGCQRSYLEPRNLYAHVRSFHDGHKFTCDECQKQFTTKVSFTKVFKQFVRKMMKLPQSILRDLGGSHGNPVLWVIEWTMKPRFSWWIILPLELWPMTSSGLKMKDWLWFLINNTNKWQC